MLSLPSNQAGIMYRLLDALLFSDAEAQRTQVLTMALVDWGKLLRLSDLTPDRIRRAIDPPHSELIRREFLKTVDYSGRGSAQQVIYTFNAQRPDHPLTPEQLLLVGRIKALGVGDGVAKKFVRASPVTFVEDRVSLAEAILAQTPSIRRSRGAYAWDILADTESRYVPPEQRQTKKESSKNTAAPSSLPKPLSLPDEDEQGTLLELSPAEQWVSARPSLRLLLKGQLSEAEFHHLEKLCLTGQMSASKLFREVSAATAKKRLSTRVKELKTELA